MDNFPASVLQGISWEFICRPLVKVYPQQSSDSSEHRYCWGTRGSIRSYLFTTSSFPPETAQALKRSTAPFTLFIATHSLRRLDNAPGGHDSYFAFLSYRLAGSFD
ncbi:ribulose-1,5-bisphosphate carboxylase/oxygenase large subunit [Striga asiatica]|uniref:Ribulose bisphosphate carboxylase large chain n=1 Tax=Striga asiatica TaxID=4170 RepID=A0A5A7Q1Y9_STRAF|nr:ribulose-1,5-bisphosphate carboxylase/oxygenase large subunit [Striga asiatica]